MAIIQGPIPGTPVVVADWRVQGHGDGDYAARCGSKGRSDKRDRSESEDDGKTPLIEKEHVQSVYDTIASHW